MLFATIALFVAVYYVYSLLVCINPTSLVCMYVCMYGIICNVCKM